MMHGYYQTSQVSVESDLEQKSTVSIDIRHTCKTFQTIVFFLL